MHYTYSSAGPPDLQASFCKLWARGQADINLTVGVARGGLVDPARPSVLRDQRQGIKVVWIFAICPELRDAWAARTSVTVATLAVFTSLVGAVDVVLAGVTPIPPLTIAWPQLSTFDQPSLGVSGARFALVCVCHIHSVVQPRLTSNGRVVKPASQRCQYDAKGYHTLAPQCKHYFWPTTSGRLNASSILHLPHFEAGCKGQFEVNLRVGVGLTSGGGATRAGDEGQVVGLL
jgi:hypothetical protein